MAYVRRVTVTVQFDGSEVVAVLKPLKFTDAMAIRGATGGEGAALELYVTMLPAYIIQLSPIIDSEGNAVEQEEILSALYFAPLVAQIMAQHVGTARAANPPKPAGK